MRRFYVLVFEVPVISLTIIRQRFACMKYLLQSLLTVFVFFISVSLQAQLPAFPTAEGAGKFSTGGRGTTAVAPTIFEVTKLTDDGSVGTFRYACTNNSPAAANRIVVFRVSGTIRLNSALSLNRANTTIAGQTAPGEGICIADYPVSIGASNIIIRYLRFRLGDKNQAANLGADDAFGDNSSDRNNIVIDHCTMSWSNDEALTLYHGTNNTIQWCFITEPLDRSYHDEGTGVQNHAYGGILSGKQLSVHHNLYAHLRGRAPRFDGIRGGVADTVDYRNNIIYNWADYNVNGGEGGSYNIVNNYYKYGPSTPNTSTAGVNRRNMLINPYRQTSPAIAYGKYYLTGNYCDNSAAVTARNWLGAAFNSGSYADSTASQVFAPFNHIPINMQAATDAYESVLAGAGCSLPRRDTLDMRIVNDVRNRTGRLIDCQGGYPSQTAFALTQGAWPALAAGTAQTDTDKDGMPDNWELARGLNTTNAADRNTYQSTSGYNNIENYLNGDTIAAVGTPNTCISVKGFTSTASGQWLHARDTTYSGYLNAAYTASADSNHIAASMLDNGSFGAFTVSYYTSTTNRTDINGNQYARRNITITPANPVLITQPVTVRLYLSLAEFNALKAADPSINTINDLQVLKSNDNTCINSLPAGFSTIVPQGYAVFGTYQNGYYIEFQTSSFSTFFFQSKLAPVPVQLSSFTVTKKEGTTALLEWQTEQEINNKQFIVQRSTGNNNWKILAVVAGQGNSTVVNKYAFVDAEAKKGIHYYRLVQEDIDGKQTLSQVRTVRFDHNVSVKLFPNPTAGEITIVTDADNKYRLQLLDIAGKLHLDETIAATVTNKNLNRFNPGLYVVKIITGSETLTYKLVIQR